MFLANGSSTFSTIDDLVFINSPKGLPKNPPDCTILCNWVFESFTLAEELFAKALPSLETCVLVNNDLWKKLFLSLESRTTFDEKFKVTVVPFLILHTFTVPCEISKTVSLAFSIVKNIIACCSRFPVKLICYIAFRSESSACCLLKSIAIILQYFLIIIV